MPPCALHPPFLVRTLTLQSYAKLNLYLNVLGTRKDGYHTLSTVFERISLRDTITLTLRKDGRIRIICASPSIPKDSTNLAYKSAKLLQDSFGIALGADIRITKRIPVGAGMGGGSGNAATVLLGLTQLWNLALSQKQLVACARKLGADVAFFIYETQFAHGSARGDRIKPLEAITAAPLWHVLVVPRIHVSTPFVYKRFDELKLLKNAHVRLTIHRFNDTLFRSALRRHDYALLAKGMANCLEPVTFSLHPELAAIKKALLSYLAIPAVLMSGSGPTVFGVAASWRQAYAVAKKLKALKKNWRIYVARTV